MSTYDAIEIDTGELNTEPDTERQEYLEEAHPESSQFGVGRGGDDYGSSLG